MSLYVTSGDAVEFELFDPAECALYDIDVEITVSSEGEELGTFNDPGDLPFLGDDAVMGCTDSAACNYDDDANVDDGSCEYPDGLDCDGNVRGRRRRHPCDEVGGCADTPPATTRRCQRRRRPVPTPRKARLRRHCLRRRWRRICDGDEIAGCQDDTACTIMPMPPTTTAPAPCGGGLDCDGNCLADADGDGICDGDEIANARTTPPATTTPTPPTTTDPALAEEGLDCTATACGRRW